MDVAVWLRNLGLSRYEAAFSDNSIDADVLPDLTDGDLAQLGVNLGDRKRLLKAIASLGSAEPARPAGQSSSKDAAERRPITVLFCDLVGSTSIAAKLDAEDWRNLVKSYLDAASAAVTRFGGRVQDRLGDGLMALFGYPQAQENDAERAVRAALAIQRALDELNARNAGKDEPRWWRASAWNPARSWWTRLAQCSARRPTSLRGCNPSPNRGRSSSPQASSARSQGCLSRKTVACMGSKACRLRWRSTASYAQAAAAGGAARAC